MNNILSRGCAAAILMVGAQVFAATPADEVHDVSDGPSRYAKSTDPKSQSNINALDAGAMPVPLESDPVPSNGDDVTIRVAAVYTDRLVADFGSEDAVIDRMREDIESLKNFMSTSLLRTRFDLVYIGKVDLREASGGAAFDEGQRVISGDYGSSDVRPHLSSKTVWSPIP